jgi:membrane-associated protease RseP (regulator of RpoE activity)
VGPPRKLVEFRLGFAVENGLAVNKLAPGEEGPTPAETMGLEPSDAIVAVNGERFGDLDGFKDMLSRNGESEAEFDVLRRGERITLRGTPMRKGELPDGRPQYVLGFQAARLTLVGEVVPGAPAGEAGLRRGDFLTKISVQPADTSRVNIEWKSADGSEGSARLAQLDHGPEFREYMPDYRIIRSGFFRSWVYGAKEVIGAVRQTYDTIGKLFSGRVALKHASGPLGIGYLFYQVSESGLSFYIALMALISVAVAVFNILPMAPLDGGLVVFLVYEAIRGKPVSARVQEAVQLVGIVLVLALFIYVTSHDILRFVS